MITGNRLFILAMVIFAVICFVSFYVVLTRSPQTERSGEEIFMAFCKSCHTSQVIKAPNIGDRQAWEARIAQGSNMLLEHVIKGYYGMPSRGTCGNCSVEELKKTIKYIVSESR